MKTKDIIKKLQEIDPLGETHVRFQAGEELIGFERKEGYYDGAYTYKDEEGRLVITDRGEKIDATLESLNDRIWACEGNLKRIKEEIVIDFLDKKNNSRYFKEVIEPEAEKAGIAHKTSLAEYTIYVMEKVKEGWTIIQLSETGQMYFKKGNQTEQLNLGGSHAVQKSGFFKSVNCSGKQEWVLNF